MSFTGAFNPTGCRQAAVLLVSRSLPAHGLIESSPKAVHGTSRLACTTGITPRFTFVGNTSLSLARVRLVGGMLEV